MTQRRRLHGFTLIELMITVAVVAILASVAYPAYTSSLVKSRRAQAQVVLSDIAQRQQQYLLDNRSYTTSTTALNLPVPSDIQAYYSFAIPAASTTPLAYTATATPVAGTAQAQDGTLTVTSDGQRLPAEKW